MWNLLHAHHPYTWGLAQCPAHLRNPRGFPRHRSFILCQHGRFSSPQVKGECLLHPPSTPVLDIFISSSRCPCPWTRLDIHALHTSSIHSPSRRGKGLATGGLQVEPRSVPQGLEERTQCRNAGIRGATWGGGRQTLPWLTSTRHLLLTLWLTHFHGLPTFLSTLSG